MRICQLAHREVVELERHNVVPDCSKHPHISKDKAEELVAQGTARPIEGGRCRIELVRPKVWRSRMSGGAAVLQMIEV